MSTEQVTSILDGLDNVCGAVSAIPTVQGRQFSPYGGVWGQQGTFSTPFGFTGEMEDENGLVYLRRRYYNHETGTFISQDPQEGSFSDPLSLNGYAYAQGDPINNTDPSGLRICSDLEESTNRSQLRTCYRQVSDLNRHFGVRLREDESLSSNLSNWTSEQVANVHAAIQASVQSWVV